MLVVHIGLRKTATTYLQQEIFPKLCQHFVPTGCMFTSRFVDLVQRGRAGPSILSELIGARIDEDRNRYGNAMLISSEGLSLPPTLYGPRYRRTVLEKVNRREFEAIPLSSYPIFQCLPALNEASMTCYGRPARILFTARSQDALLASEYSQQSSISFAAGQKHFEAAIRKYLASDDPYADYHAWAQELDAMVGPSGFKIFFTEKITTQSAYEAVQFCGAESSCDEVEAVLASSQRRNVKHSQEPNIWSVRPLMLRTIVKPYVPTHRRGAAFKLLVKLLNVVDAASNTFVHREKNIHLSSDLANLIEERYARKNAALQKQFRANVIQHTPVDRSPYFH